MKKVLVLFLLLLTFVSAEPLVVKDKEVIVGGRNFTYYCVDFKLWLETKNGNKDYSSTFIQVYRTDATNIPEKCSYNPDGTIKYNKQ